MGTLAWRGPRLIFVLTLSRAAMGSAPVRVRAMLHHNVDYFPASIAINQIQNASKVPHVGSLWCSWPPLVSV